MGIVPLNREDINIPHLETCKMRLNLRIVLRHEVESTLATHYMVTLFKASFFFATAHPAGPFRGAGASSGEARRDRRGHALLGARRPGA